MATTDTAASEEEFLKEKHQKNSEQNTKENDKKRPATNDEDEHDDAEDNGNNEGKKKKDDYESAKRLKEDNSPTNTNATNTATTTNANSPSASAAKQTTPALPVWVRTTQTQLSEEQLAKLEKAKAYAQELLAQQPALLARTLAAPTAIPAPGISSTADPRVVNMMSRVYVGSIPFEVTDQHIRVVFNQFGYINNIGMNMDPSTGKHKGFCFVEYEAPEAATLALATMDGYELGGRKLRVGRPNNYQAQTAIPIPPPPKARVYVANVSEFVTEENIASIFDPFGTVVKCILIPDFSTRKHKNYGYIEFEEEIAASTAVESMNNFDLGGLQLRVILAVIGGTMGEGMKALDRVPKLATNAAVLGAKVPAGLTAGALAAHTTAARIASDLAAKGLLGSHETVAREENLSISSNQRFAIMQALSRSESATAAASSLHTPSSTTSSSAAAAASSPVLLVRNSVAASDVDEDLTEEFAEECGKFGKVTRVHLHVDKTSEGDGLGIEDGRQVGDGDVRIFVQFVDAIGSERARTNLDGRWFGGRRIKATLYDLSKFHAADYGV